MLYKPDFDECRKRIQAFWENESTDRCALQVIAKIEGYKPRVEDNNADLITRKTNIDYILEKTEQVMQIHCYLAEAVPVYIPGLVCSDTAAFLSEGIDIREDTVWYPPIIDEWDEFSFTFDRDNKWWQLVKRMTEAAVKRGKGKYLIAIPDFQVAIDIVSLLRSPQKLCIDLIENPNYVKRATEFILNDVYVHCYHEIRSIIASHSDVAADWLGLFSVGNHDIIQCDFSALISPRHFEEFCLPDIQRQCSMLDYSIYHLDGPDAIKHLDMILEVKELNAIQWVPGAGKPPARAWTAMLKKIQQAGKSVYIHSPARDVEGILEELSPRGLMINVEDVFESVSEAEAFIERVRVLCHARRWKNL